MTILKHVASNKESMHLAVSQKILSVAREVVLFERVAKMKTLLYITMVMSVVIGLTVHLSYSADLFGTNNKSLAVAIVSTDFWWQSIRNEDQDFYEEVDLGKVIVHLCGSREKLAEVHNSRYPKTPYDPRGSTYMFSSYGGTPPAHIWLVVKLRDEKVLLHKWAAGHELANILRCFSTHLEDAYKY